MRKKVLKRKVNERGITLIALVITIIVLLILAGVSISMLTGENGILKRANEAKEETAKATEDEQRKMAMLEAAMNTELTHFQNVPIPAGFAPTRIAGESTVDEGLVITDSEGNEFVWIPLKEESEYKRNKNYKYVPVSEKAKDDTEYLPDGITIEAGKEGDKEKEIVTKAGGFYISKYEAGKEGSNEPYVLVSKKGANVWNNIKQYDDETEKGCKTIAKTFINNSEVKSGLITGTQWDVVMEFVNGKKDGNGKVFDITTEENNRHTGSKAQSGQNPADKVCNIYDLEGNYFEYVAEKSDYNTKQPYVIRGGDDGNKKPPFYRFFCDGNIQRNYSFRIVLYVMQD